MIPHHDTWSEDKAQRTLELAPAGLPVVGIDERTALLRDPDGTWRADGAGEVTSTSTARIADLAALP